MKVNGIVFGSALFLTGMLIKNFEVYLAESIIGSLILYFTILGCWYLAFDNEQLTNSEEIEK